MRHIQSLILAPVLLLGVLAGTVVAGSPLARAASPHSVPVTLYPSDSAGTHASGEFWTETANPGNTLKLYATVGNPGDKKVSLRLLPVDTATAEYGGLSYSLASQPLRKAGTWVRLPKTQFTIAPGKGFVLPFILHVPRGIRPGQYVAGLAATPPPSARSQGAIGIQVQTRIAIPIVITIPGPRIFRLALRRVGTGGRNRNVTLHLFNSGNMLLKATGHLWVWRHGRSMALLSVPLTIGTTVPQLPFQYPVALGPRPVATSYTYKLQLFWTGGNLTTHGTFRLGK